MIPKSFTLINRTYDVVAFTPNMGDVAEAHGAMSREKALVWLNTEDSSSAESLAHTFFHELAHALLEAASRDKLSDNEELVDQLGALLHQYMQTKKGKFEKAT